MDLIDILGWEILYTFHIFILFDQSCIQGRRGQFAFFGGHQNSHAMLTLVPCHRLNIERCMIEASDHDMLEFTPELKQTCCDLMTHSERYVVKLINACVC